MAPESQHPLLIQPDMTTHRSYKFQLEIGEREDAFHPFPTATQTRPLARILSGSRKWLVILRESFRPLRLFPPRRGSALDFSLSTRVPSATAVAAAAAPPSFIRISPAKPTLFSPPDGVFIYYPWLLQRTAASRQLSVRSSRVPDAWCAYSSRRETAYLITARVVLFASLLTKAH